MVGSSNGRRPASGPLPRAVDVNRTSGDRLEKASEGSKLLLSGARVQAFLRIWTLARKQVLCSPYPAALLDVMEDVSIVLAPPWAQLWLLRPDQTGKTHLLLSALPGKGLRSVGSSVPDKCAPSRLILQAAASTRLLQEPAKYRRKKACFLQMEIPSEIFPESFCQLSFNLLPSR